MITDNVPLILRLISTKNSSIIPQKDYFLLAVVHVPRAWLSPASPPRRRESSLVINGSGIRADHQPKARFPVQVESRPSNPFSPAAPALIPAAEFRSTMRCFQFTRSGVSKHSYYGRHSLADLWGLWSSIDLVMRLDLPIITVGRVVLLNRGSGARLMRRVALRIHCFKASVCSLGSSV